MFDAFGRVPSGVTQGDYLWLGSFDECTAVSQKIFNDANDPNN